MSKYNATDYIEMYNSIKTIKESISNIDKDFFFNFVETLLSELETLKADLYSANCIIDEQIDLLKNSISKDKIERTIEKLEDRRRKKGMSEAFATDIMINALQKLLEGDD